MTEENAKLDGDLIEEESSSSSEESFSGSDVSSIEECCLNDEGICLLPEYNKTNLLEHQNISFEHVSNPSYQKSEKKCVNKPVKNSLSKKGQNEMFLVVNHCIRKYFYGNTEAKKKILSGFYYQATHWLVMILACIVLFFVNDVIFLSAYVFVFFLDALAIVILHDCPLTRLEEKSLGTSIVDYRKKLFRSCGIRYECNHNYETQLDIIFNLVSLLIIKIGLIISYRWFIQNKNTI